MKIIAPLHSWAADEDERVLDRQDYWLNSLIPRYVQVINDTQYQMTLYVSS